MREMKDSGIKWIGEIPNQWDLHRLQYCLSEISVKNNPIQTNNVLSLVKDKGVMPYEEKGNQGNKAKEDVREYKLAYPNTLVVNSMNILIGSVGMSDYFGCVSPVYYVFKDTENADLRFINYIFNTRQFQTELRKYAKGILEIRLRVSSTDIFKQKIALPTKEKQTKIADYLDKKCVEIDSLLNDIKEEINILESYKKSIITEAITKGLNPNVEMKDSGIDWIGMIPKHWVTGKIKLYTSKVGSGKTPKGDNNLYSEGNILFLRSQNVYNTGLVLDNTPTVITEEIDKTMASTRVKQDDVLLNITGGSIGRCCIYSRTDPANVNQHVCIIRTRKNKMLAAFMYYFWISNTGQTAIQLYQTGGNREGMSAEAINNTQIPLPDLNEQDAICKYLNKKCAEFDTIIVEKKEQLEILTEYKKSLIYEYVTGKKDVPAESDKENNYDLNPILLGTIINKLGEYQTGRIQLQKILYLACVHLGLNQNAQYYRYNHGPYDINLNEYIDSLTKNHWFDEKREKSIVLVPGKRKEEFLDKYKEQIDNYNGKIVDLLNLLYRMNCLKRSRLERITTLYAVWNDLLLDGANPSDDEIINEVVTNWTDNKSNIQYSTWQDSLDKMKKYGLIPKGVGYHTISKPQKEALNDYE